MTLLDLLSQLANRAHFHQSDVDFTIDDQTLAHFLKTKEANAFKNRLTGQQRLANETHVIQLK